MLDPTFFDRLPKPEAEPFLPPFLVLLYHLTVDFEAKLKAVKDYVKELLNTTNDKFLLFAHHKVMLTALAGVISDAGVGYIFIDGSVSSESRKEQVDRFQTQDSVRVAVLSITAANAGITLTAASSVIFAELFWNPGVLTQVRC